MPDLLTVGVEEEYLLVDPVTREVVPEGQEVVAQASAGGLGDRVTTELTRYQVEARTEPHVVMDGLGEQIRSMRAAVAEAAEQRGSRAISCGAPVLVRPTPPPISEGRRYAESIEVFRALNDSHIACACHIHVGVADLGLALQVSNHIRPWLPALIALSANSPYWAGRDTGYASWRAISLACWPVAGPPPYFESPAHFNELVDAVIEPGGVMDRAGLYWDIRPSSHVPTLEIRVADAVATAEETVLLSAIVRAAAATALSAVHVGEPAPRPQPEILRVACWRAARDGLAGESVDLPTTRLVPATARIDQLLTWIEPALRQHGDLELVLSGWSRLRAEGGGADRQRLAYRRRASFTDVVDHLIASTTTGDRDGMALAQVVRPQD
ncbi:carboxylate-amine ligase [Saccharopolyspora antimicrobica]|uniref:Putative glutamate--cysteine ligase 2 n=1 Tax=Saccharopolyspora antimicrobica TaxID=455193 RepID=A0A1I4VSR5_9PSEU|nr:glutamate--cysteine ligase [Saccharopolyspora antimicrobica]RKT87235.1 carboxylate-amine ligase [Saccharopolyspora antimicrobica]SFN04006.1 carboxylate-amine ligase [Saccharopolyspora antimicrobica]